MRKYTLRELRELVRLGLAQDVTTAAELPEGWRRWHRVGYVSGRFGIAAGLAEDPQTGEKYVILARNSNLFRVF